MIEKDDTIRRMESELLKYKQKPVRSDASQAITPKRKLLELPIDPTPPSFHIRVDREKSRPKSNSRCLTPTTKQELLGLEAVRELSRQFKLSLKQLYSSYQSLKG